MQLDGHEWGYFHKIWIEYYCLNKNHALETLGSRFTGCQNPYQLQNIKILLTFQGRKNPHRQNFWNLDFFISKGKATLILPEQKSTCGHIIFIHKSNNEIIDKIGFIKLKTE